MLECRPLCGVDMEFTDFQIWKGIAIVVLIAIYGFWKGFTGR